MSKDWSTEINMLTARCAELEAKLAAANLNTDIPDERDPTDDACFARNAATSYLRHRIEDQNPAFRRRTFTEIFLNHSGYLSDKWAQFLPIYDFELQPMIARGRPLRLLEIGVQNGGSLQIWHEYLPEGSQIYGLDIDERCRRLDFPPQVKVLVGDAGDPATLDDLLGDEVFDIIIDDGSHQSRDVIAAAKALLPRLVAGGKYFIEDLHASYWSSYGGGFRKVGTSIEHIKNIVDALHADYFQASDLIEDDERYTLTDLNARIGRVSFYDSIAVIASYPRPKLTPFNRVLSGRQIKVTGLNDLLDAIAANSNEFILFGGATDVVVSAATRKVSDLRQETLRQKADIEQRTAIEAALRADIEQRTAIEAALRADIEQRAAAQAVLQGEIDQRTASEAALRSEIDQRTASEAALRVEINRGAETEAALRNALDQAEREAGDWAARVEALRADIATVRAELTKANRGLDERAAAAEGLKAEIEVLRGTPPPASAICASVRPHRRRSRARSRHRARGWPLPSGRRASAPPRRKPYSESSPRFAANSTLPEMSGERRSPRCAIRPQRPPKCRGTAVGSWSYGGALAHGRALRWLTAQHLPTTKDRL